MLQNFQTVGLQVLIMLILMLVGLLARKASFLQENTVKNLADIMLYIITPCVVIKSFQRDFDPALLRGFLIASLAAIFAHGLSIVLGRLCIRSKEEGRKRVLQFGVVFSNCGFLSIPLLQAVLGDEGVFYGAAYLAVFNIFVWTYGVLFMSRGNEKITAKTMLLHPGILCVAVGLCFFFSSIRLPDVIYQPIEYLSHLNTPIPMMIIGYYLAGVRWKFVLRRVDEGLLYILRLLVIPLTVLAALYLFGVRGTLLTACTISASAPVAALSTMFAAKYDGDAVLSAQVVSVSTVFSLLSMTLIVGLSLSLTA